MSLSRGECRFGWCISVKACGLHLGERCGAQNPRSSDSLSRRERRDRTRRRYNSHADMRVARRYLVEGRVKGVGFRYFTEAAASREGLSGWVQNLPDGRVEILAEGEAEAVERFEHKVRHGPPGAR